MIDTLIEKIVNYKDPKIMPINQGSYYVETTENASYLVCPGSVVAFVNDGRVLRLSLKCNPFEWALHNELYEIVSKSNYSRMEIPIDYYPVVVASNNYYYSEVLRPNKELGLHFMDEVKTNIIDDLYIENYIYDTAVMMNNLKFVCDKNDHNRVPRELLAPYKRNKDSIGYFWVDFKTWDFSFDKFVEKKIRTLYLTMLSLGPDFDYNKLMRLAENEWKFFYE